MLIKTEALRNLSIIGHTGTGKTTLTEQLLFSGSIIPKPEKVESGRSVSDNTEEEVKRVAHGASRGAKIGFPTANLEAIDTLLPGAGVYAGIGTSDSATWPAAIHIGSNPTFGETVVKVEVHLIGMHEQIYGQALEVDFLSRVREVRPFPDLESLQRQLTQDVATAKQIALKYMEGSTQR